MASHPPPLSPPPFLTDHDHAPDEAAALPLPEGARSHSLGPDLALLELPRAEAEVPSCLSAAEREVARAVFDGASTRELARARGVSVKTVGNQLDAIYRKLGVVSRTELVLRLRRQPRHGGDG